MLVLQFHSKRWTTSIEGKPILCYFYPEIKLVDPFGFELVTVLWTFCSESLFRSLLRVRLFSLLFLKKITENQMCLQSLFVSEK